MDFRRDATLCLGPCDAPISAPVEQAVRQLIESARASGYSKAEVLGLIEELM
ncbi:hypothetical protein ACFWF7_18240 [Nocardia sp. NPDC060256]|uniref:hypothetical protein n=1 Tax=unclassified Nocardia TaxID=2637762 RepID=UPI00366660FD